ncbi:N-acetyltransferase, partial [candidate division KSB1 bacterium]|nr:N-acetyltransferase [candidate division KSB1 bacterium]
AVGYQITLPDLNVILKKLNGRLMPFGIFQLLFGLKRIRQYRIWAMGVIPNYQRKAIDTLFYREMYRVLRGRMPVKLEANWVLEDNMAMNNPILKLGFEHVKTYRVYEAEL